MRFRSGVTYPFADSFRFSAIVDDRFLFLRGERLEIYTDAGLVECLPVATLEVAAIIRDHFGYDLASSLHQFSQRTTGSSPPSSAPEPLPCGTQRSLKHADK